jgi:pyruvate dehydrogenase E2 component (dihydrolipoamide acetyltransferase)
MAIPVTIPPLGWSTDEAIFSAWRMPDGSDVKPGDALFTLESDKATQDVESLDAGTLRIPPNGPKPSDRLTVGTVIGYLVAKNEVAPFETETPPQPQSSVRNKSEEQASLALRDNGGAEYASAVGRSNGKSEHRHSASPRARRAAVALGVDVSQMKGSGSSGRIRERDVRAAAATVATTGQRIAVTPLRQTIAANMLESQRATAPVTLTTTAEATQLVNLRRQFQEASPDTAPSYTDFIVKLTAIALREHPHLNARWLGDHIELLPEIHIGIAVDTEAGLLVPVVRDVGTMGIRELAKRTRDLIERTRQRTLSASEMQGGTFTVTNLGAFGIDAFTPVIRVPEAAILGIGRIRQEPTVHAGQIVIHDVVTLSLTFDHRLVDGAPAARFLQRLATLIKNPAAWLM